MMNKTSFILLGLLFSVPVMHAQVPVGRAVAGGLAEKTAQETVSRALAEDAAAKTLATSAAEKTLTETVLIPNVSQPVTNTTISSNIAATQHRSWLEQQRRNFKAWQLKRQHAKNVQSAQQIREIEQRLAQIAQLETQQSFEVSSLTDLTVDLSVPSAVPFLEHPSYLYRGLGLPADGQAVRHILEKGLLLEDVGEDGSHFIASISSPRGSKTANSLIKVTNLTKDPSIALKYAVRHTDFSDNSVPVIVKVKGILERADVVRHFKDIPSNQIEEMIVLLNYNGKSTWCRVELTESGSFKITPYKQLNPAN